jgi:Xaa-Pro dipeptidase
MAVVASEQPGPMSSAEIPIPEVARIADIEMKQARVAEFLDREGLDALLLETPANFAWFTSGGNCSREGGATPMAALFITPTARVVVCHNSETSQIFDHEIHSLGFQLKERAWTEPLSEILADLCRGRRVGSDRDFPNTQNFSEAIRQLRTPLTPFECSRIRTLGRNVVHAVEATARSLKSGRIESEIAGEMAHRLIKHQITPRRLQVLADSRGRRYRHWRYDDTPVRRWVTLLAIGSRWGLCVGVSRTIAFTQLDTLTIAAMQHATMLTATAARFSTCGWKFADTMDRVRRIYEKAEEAEEWRHAPLGGVIGYDPDEDLLLPKSDYLIQPQTALFYHPTVGPAVAAETILTMPDGFEILTPPENWPTIEVTVKDLTVTCPGILPAY